MEGCEPRAATEPASLGVLCLSGGFGIEGRESGSLSASGAFCTGTKRRLGWGRQDRALEEMPWLRIGSRKGLVS